VRLAVFDKGSLQLVSPSNVVNTANLLRTTTSDGPHLRLPFTAPDSGSYIVAVLSMDGSGSGPYRITAASRF
jgi:hypothetical protein